MKKSIIKTMLTFLLMVTVSYATSFEVTQVIEVDSEVGGPKLGPIKWSPDGLKLSYFKGKQLFISDTLGNSTFVKELELFPHRYEWLDNDKLVIHIEKFEGPKSTNKLVSVDVNTLQESLISSYIYQVGKSNKIAGFETFRGPLLTQEGDVYYELNTFTGIISNPKNIERISANQNNSQSSSVQESNIINWDEDKLYLKKINESDSTLLRSGFGTQDLFVKVSNDNKFISISYNLINIEADSSIMLLDFIQELPANTYYCDMIFNNFNPTKNELIFQIDCEGEEPYSTSQVGLFDYDMNEFTIIDTIINLNNCHSPIYCPDGKKFALISESNIYIINRSWVE